MDLHIYRNSQDRWHHLKLAARERGGILGLNAVTVDELVERITPDLKTASPGQRVALLQRPQDVGGHRPPLQSEFQFPNFTRYAYEAVGLLKAARVRVSELKAAGADALADILKNYDDRLHLSGVVDPQDRRSIAAARVREGAVQWLNRFDRAVLHALYDLTEAEFLLVRALIESCSEGGVVVLFNTTTNVKPTQFAEWTWQRFIYDDLLAEKTVPEFCRTSHPSRAVLDRLFKFEPGDPLPADNSLRIIEAPGRYKEIETIGAEISDLLIAGENPNEIAVVVRHIDTYGEMLEDVFSRYEIPHSFETGMPILRVPFIKYWLAVLDLVTSERSREALGRVMSSAYFDPRLSPRMDADRLLSSLGYIDRHHLRASALARRKNSPLVSELDRFEQWLDGLESSTSTVAGFAAAVRPLVPLLDRDRAAWRLLEEELVAVGGLMAEPVRFAQFRKIASEIAAVRTINRSSRAAAAPGIPRVRIVGPHSLGLRPYRWIFAPGLTEGEFPAPSSVNPLLPQELAEAINLHIRPRRILTSRDNSRREPLYLFMILDSATHRVTLTYSGVTLEGEQMYPSPYIHEINRHFEEPVVQLAPEISRSSAARAKGEWLTRIAEQWQNGSFPPGRAQELLGAEIMSRVEREQNTIARTAVGRGLLPLDGVWHPSELNALAGCPFVFLARHRLRLRSFTTPDFEIPALEIGILAHNILRDFYSAPIPASFDAARKRMNESVARRLTNVDVNGQGTYSVFEPALWKIRRRQLVAVLDEYVKFAVRDAVDGFQTQPAFLDAPLPPAPLGRILLAGKPDHVAVHRAGDRIDAIRIDDFKYSAASSSTVKQLKESFQIPVYAYLASRALEADPGARIDGRYLLLRSPSNPVVSYSIDDAVFRDVQGRIEALIVKVSEGRLHPDPADRQDCLDCEYRRLCRLYGS
jgi:ATP-dependent helicase/DNAse subunit B